MSLGSLFLSLFNDAFIATNVSDPVRSEQAPHLWLATDYGSGSNGTEGCHVSQKWGGGDWYVLKTFD